MEIKLTWSKLFVLWVVYLVATTVFAVPMIFVASVVGGLFGYFAGIPEPYVTNIASLLGVVLYLCALKFALSKTYRGFKIVLVPTLNS